MFRKILVANRGEIAVRILRACRELGIPSVAVFSEADREALHVQLADEAYCIGPPSPPESYLKIPAYLELAERIGVDAVHPGYGFLAENAGFASACEKAGIRFIGPSSRAIAAMGDKLEARRGAERLDVPLIPGTLGESLSAAEIEEQAQSIGFPVMLKAVGGGGGKGMRIVERAEDVRSAFETATSEARTAFGNGDVYLEKCLTSARHVEVQIARDSHGNSVHFYERECSVQRRHQKLIEEAPAAISKDLRDRMTKAALRIADGIEYESLGTVEFLVAGDEFYFLEMNTRLQVEHPVTEMITGFDLVKLQIAIAAGEPIGIEQEAVPMRGHAVEARICAEDPRADFFPSTGEVTGLHLPGGAGVRVDTDLRVGYSVTLYYDPLVAKVIAYADSRTAALDKMSAALRELQIAGIRTTRDVLRRVVDDGEFRNDGYDTSYLARFLERDAGEPDADARRLAAIAAVLESHRAHRRDGLSLGTSKDENLAAESAWVREGRSRAMRGSFGA